MTDLSPTRPLTQDSIDIIHWYARRGFSPARIAKEINRPTETIRRVLRETQPPKPQKTDLWPRREAAIRGRLPSYMTVMKGLTA